MNNFANKLNELGIILDSIENREYYQCIPVPGSKGQNGPQGKRGFQGQYGFQGMESDLQGNQGTQGSNGIQGLSGSNGLVGQNGNQGNQGSVGQQGLQGLIGGQGNQGNQGNQGQQGNQGLQGSQGSIGIQGQSGTQGQQGFMGAQGMAIVVPSGNTVMFYTNNNIGTFTIPWPLTSAGLPSPIIFITLAAGGGGSGGTDIATLLDVSAPGGSGGGGGFVRRLSVEYEPTMTDIQFTVGFGGPGGLGAPTSGSPGGDSSFNIVFNNNNINTGTILRCIGGGGGTPGGIAVDYPQVASGYGGGVQLDPTLNAGNLPRIICPNANGHLINTIDQSTAIPVESSKINGYFESGSGGVCATSTPGPILGAPNVTNSQVTTASPFALLGPGGTSGVTVSGRGANTIDYMGESTGLPGLTGNTGIFIMEYLF